MIDKMIADNIMCCPRQTREQLSKFDIEHGVGRGIELFNNEWKRVEFSVDSEDVVIKGEYIINPNDTGVRKKVAIICHGQTAERISDCKYGAILYDLGYNLVFFDERYHGASTGDYCTLGWKENLDIKKVISFAKSVFGEDMFYGMHGESMGAASELILLDTEKPDFMIADCPFADLELLIHDLAWRQAKFLAPIGMKGARKLGLKRCGFDYTKVKPIESVKISDVPICFMHGNADSLIDHKHSEMLYKASKNPLSEIHLFEGADHALSMASAVETYEKILKDFVLKIERNCNDKN